MSNLLPQKNKKNILNEYILRSVIVFFSLSFVVISIAIILLVPSFILSQVKRSGIDRQVNVIKKAEASKQNTFLVEVLKSENEKIKALNSDDKISFIGTIKKIINDKPKDVKINGFMYDKSLNKKTKNHKIGLVIKGIAKNRGDLVGFINRLKLEDELSHIDSPISNLVKDENINFSIRMIIINNNVKNNLR